MTPEVPPKDLELPVVVVKAEQRYVLGFPLLISVTLDNPPGGPRFFSLPELDLFFSHGPIGVRLDAIGKGTSVSFPPSPTEDLPGGMALEAGEQLQALLDLSNFGLDLQPGSYWLSLTLKVARYSRSSKPVRVDFVKPSDTDFAEGNRLRKMGGPQADFGAWGPFLKNNPSAVTVSPNLSPQARQQLALHLFLHHAIYSPAPLSNLDPTPLQQITSPVLQSEVVALRLEIEAAKSPGGSLPAVSSFPPGIKYRIEDIQKGQGFIMTYRRVIGAEQRHPYPHNQHSIPR